MESWRRLPARITNDHLRSAERSASLPPPISSCRGSPPAGQSRVVPSQGSPAVRASAFPLPRVHRVTIGDAVPCHSHVTVGSVVLRKRLSCQVLVAPEKT